MVVAIVAISDDRGRCDGCRTRSSITFRFRGEAAFGVPHLSTLLRVDERHCGRPNLPKEPAAPTRRTTTSAFRPHPEPPCHRRFVADEDAEEHTRPLVTCVALPFESAMPSPEATGRSADTQQTEGPLSDLPAIARVAFSAPGRGKCRMPPLRRRRQHLAGGLNGKIVQ